MKLPSSLVTVTPLSKTIALLMFISLPIIAFLFGMNYQRALENKNNSTAIQQGCTDEARICPDGSTVGRTAPNCEFEACPKPSANDETIQCGGIRGLVCPDGYICGMEGRKYPDASGICVKVAQSEDDYVCPETEYIDCMPGTFMMKQECTRGYLQWAEDNCPSFKGAAY